jgi:hypothetical protein
VVTIDRVKALFPIAGVSSLIQRALVQREPTFRLPQCARLRAPKANSALTEFRQDRALRDGNHFEFWKIGCESQQHRTGRSIGQRLTASRLLPLVG